MRSILLPIVLTCAGALHSALASQGWTESSGVQVELVSMQNSGDAIIELSGSTNNPGGCTVANKVRIQANQAQFEARVSLMISAMLSNSDVRFYVDGCVGDLGKAIVQNIQKP